MDCFKYLCLSYDEHFKRFEELHANVDLTSIDNGDFLPKLHKMRKTAVELVLEAKKLDLEGKDENELYETYEKAYNAYDDSYKLIEGSHEKLDRARKLSNRKDVMTIVGFVVGILGLAASVIFGIMSLQ